MYHIIMYTGVPVEWSWCLSYGTESASIRNPPVVQVRHVEVDTRKKKGGKIIIGWHFFSNADIDLLCEKSIILY